MQQFAHWIDGKAREASTGGWLDVFDPATGKPFARAAKGSPDDVEAAVSAAQAAFPAWPSLPATERSRLLAKLAGAIHLRVDRFAHAAPRDGGKPFATRQSRGETKRLTIRIDTGRGRARQKKKT